MTSLDSDRAHETLQTSSRALRTSQTIPGDHGLSQVADVVARLGNSRLAALLEERPQPSASNAASVDKLVVLQRQLIGDRDRLSIQLQLLQRQGAMGASHPRSVQPTSHTAMPVIQRQAPPTTLPAPGSSSGSPGAGTPSTTGKSDAPSPTTGGQGGGGTKTGTTGPDAGSGGQGTTGGGSVGPSAGPPAGDGVTTLDYKFDGSAALETALNDRANPQAKSAYDEEIGAADTLRINSLQYTFYPAGFWKNFKQGLVPSDQFVEHWGQLGATNAYRGPDTGFLATLNKIVETLRGVLHLIGDIASTVSSIAGVVALISAGLALITSETVIGGIGFGAIAAGAATVATVGAAIKLAADIIDMVLGVIQILILAGRARLSNDPNERKRIAQLLNKESSDFAQNLVGVAFQGAAVGLSAVGGGVAAKVGGKTFASGARAAMLDFTKVFSSAGRAELAAGIRMLVQMERVSAEVGKQVAAQTARESIVISKEQLDGLLQRAKLTHQGKLLLDLKTGLGIGLVPSQTLNYQAATSKAQGGIGGTSPSGGARGQSGKGTSVPLAHVAAWPAILQEMTDARSLVHNAQDRMRDQYTLARDDLDEVRASDVDAQLGKLDGAGTRIKVTGGQARQEAAAQQVQSEQNAAQGAKAEDLRGQAQSKVAGAQGDANSAHAKAQESKPPTGFFAYIGTYIARFQTWVQDLVRHIALSAAGLSPDELKLAGVKDSWTEDAKTSQDAQKEAGTAEQQADKVQQAVTTLRQDRSRRDQNAVQGMADTLTFIEALDNAEQFLGSEVQAGSSYIEKVSPVILRELAVRSGKPVEGQPEDSPGKIDEKYVAPILDAAGPMKKDIAASAPALRDSSSAALASIVGTVSSSTGSVPTKAQSEGNQLIDTVVGKVTTAATAATSDIDLIVTETRKAVGGDAAILASVVQDLASRLEHANDEFLRIVNAARDEIRAGLTKVVAALTDAARQVAPDPPQAPSDQQKGATPSPVSTP